MDTSAAGPPMDPSTTLPAPDVDRSLAARRTADMAARARPASTVYAILTCIVVVTTPLLVEHPVVSIVAVVGQGVFGWLRHRMTVSFLAGGVAQVAPWEREFTTLTRGAALLWGLMLAACAVWYPVGQPLLETLVCTAGLACGACLSLSPNLGLLRSYLALLLVPMLPAFVLHPAEWAVPLLVVVYLAFMWTLASQMADWYDAATRDNLKLNTQTQRLAQAAREAATSSLRLLEETAERQAQATRLERVTRLNSAILEAAGEGILGLDGVDRIIFANPAAGRTLGRTVAELQCETLHDLLHSDQEAPCSGCPDSSSLQHSVGALVSFKSTFYRPDGASFPVEVLVTPIQVEGEASGKVVIFKDITDRQAIERLKDEFVSVVSHELRTPLTAIKAPLGLLAGGYMGTLTDKGTRLLTVALSNTDRLINLVNDILDYERLEAGKAALDLQPVEIDELMSQVKSVTDSLLEAAGVTMLLLAQGGSIVIDSARIQQVLINLIGNAIKFSPAGAAIGVNVTLGLEAVTFEVADQGRGIPEEQRRIIFEPFHQVNASDSRDKGGTGLGLAISRSIVHHHGGRIWVESNVGRGSSFFISLPVPPPGWVQPAPAEAVIST